MKKFFTTKKIMVLCLLWSMILLMGASGGGCDSEVVKVGSQEMINTSAYTEQDQTEKAQQKYIENQPAYFPDYSLERENINKKTKMFSNPNLVGYIYLFNYGNIVGFYDVKGKVTNNSSQITNTSQILVDHPYSGVYNTTAIESPQPDGTYGTSGDGIYWFDTKGKYHEWKGDYMYSDTPLKLNAQTLVSTDK